MVLQGVVTSHGPYWKKRYNPQAGQWEAWNGEVKSEEIHIHIVPPVGLDKAAYETMNKCPMCDPSKLLKDFPTSTYAAYVVWERSDAKGQAASEPTKVLKAIETGLLLQSEMVLPCIEPSGATALRRLNGKQAIDCRAYWYDLILKNHPDIWFADQLRLRTALDQITLKNYQAAETDLKAIAQDTKSPMKDKAQQYLDLMKQKGWTKG